MKQFTYADWELLLQTFDSLTAKWDGADDEFLMRACQWAKSIAPTFGFEHALTRDVAVLSRYLVDRDRHGHPANGHSHRCFDRSIRGNYVAIVYDVLDPSGSIQM